MLSNIGELEILLKVNKKLEKEETLVFEETFLPFYLLDKRILKKINQTLDLEVIPSITKGGENNPIIFTGYPSPVNVVSTRSSILKEDFSTIDKKGLIINQRKAFFLLGHMDSYLLGKLSSNSHKNIFKQILNRVSEGQGKMYGLYLQKIGLKIIESEDNNRMDFVTSFYFVDGKGEEI